MARSTSTNFTGGLDFTLATAATDLFVKEDVQTLAQAVDQHDHTAGKGLPLPAGTITSAMIADGTIVAGDLADNAVTTAKILNGAVTTAKIADGTIATADIAADAVTQLIGSYLAIPTFSTTLVGTWVGTPVSSGLIACSGARVRIVCSGVAFHSAAGSTIYMGLMIDGGNAYTLASANPAANSYVPFCFEVYYTPSVTSHTFQLQVQGTIAGTLSLAGNVQHALYVTEERR